MRKILFQRGPGGRRAHRGDDAHDGKELRRAVQDRGDPAGDTAPGIIRREGKLIPIPAIFGFPGFSGKKLLLNARSETAGEKRTFAESLRSRRIVLPASGFYEWDREKVKYYFTLEPGPVIYLCGLYQVTEGACRFLILTRAANESMVEVHGRMPVILSAEKVRAYLTDEEAAKALIAAEAPMLMRAAV